jgi:hypothetical protein
VSQILDKENIPQQLRGAVTSQLGYSSAHPNASYFRRPSVNNLNLQIPLSRDMKPNVPPLLQLQKLPDRKNHCLTSHSPKPPQQLDLVAKILTQNQPNNYQFKSQVNALHAKIRATRKS